MITTLEKMVLVLVFKLCLKRSWSDGIGGEAFSPPMKRTQETFRLMMTTKKERFRKCVMINFRYFYRWYGSLPTRNQWISTESGIMDWWWRWFGRNGIGKRTCSLWMKIYRSFSLFFLCYCVFENMSYCCIVFLK